MNYLVVIAIIVIALIVYVAMNESESYNSYASLTLPLSLSSPSCKNAHNYTNVYDGYQMAPPAKDNPCGVGSDNHYLKLNVSYPREEPSYKECKDAYRCRTLGVATGVQGKIM